MYSRTNEPRAAENTDDDDDDGEKDEDEKEEREARDAGVELIREKA